jgi:hypothetical protein
MVSVMFIGSCFLSFVRSGGFVAAAGGARDVAGDDADPDAVEGDLLAAAIRLVSQVVVTMGQAAFWRGERASHR